MNLFIISEIVKNAHTYFPECDLFKFILSFNPQSKTQMIESVKSVKSDVKQMAAADSSNLI